MIILIKNHIVIFFEMNFQNGKNIPNVVIVPNIYFNLSLFSFVIYPPI